MAFSVSAIVGIVLAVHGIITDVDEAYEFGWVVLLIGLAGIVDTRFRINAQRVIDHTTNVATLAEQERQSYAEMGWKAARLSATSEPGRTAGAQIVELPTRHTSEMRRGGSA
ncbi:hypothetical protein ACIHCX_10945 [Streptomyces sp. NPDC052043]|uniref:hypothetical protein n=1 Tax=Streptomyces sp. NPDC052043 TaxID=3365684 RepID=UPI0037D7A071